VSTVRFRMQVQSGSGHEAGRAPWWETYEREGDGLKGAEDAATSIILYFNNTLKPGESPRSLLAVELLDEDPREHKWFKVTAMTQHRNIGLGSQIYDKMQCERCGVTGKRFNLNAKPTLDSQYRAAYWKRCDLAKPAMEKKQVKEAARDE
jgi:hypothetical protein